MSKIRLPLLLTRKCAKCRDSKKWTPAEDVNGDGVLWHWRKYGNEVTALAARCMKQRTRWSGNRWRLALFTLLAMTCGCAKTEIDADLIAPVPDPPNVSRCRPHFKTCYMVMIPGVDMPERLIPRFPENLR